MKKTILPFLLMVNILWPLLGNDTYTESSGGNLKLASEEHSQISILEEILTLEIYDDYYRVIVNYTFDNEGPERVVTTGFPDFTFGTRRRSELRNFSCHYSNGETIPWTYVSGEEDKIDFVKIAGWYKKDITFAGEGYTGIRISYEADYSVYGYYNSIFYLLGTASRWKGELPDLTVQILNRSQNRWIEDLILRDANRERLDFNFHTLGPRHFLLTIKDLKFYDSQIITLTASKFPGYDTPPLSGVKEFFAQRRLSFEDVQFYTPEQLRITRNYIYALRGYPFKSEDLLSYFQDQRWYQINPDFSEGDLTPMEKANVDFLYHLEQEIPRTPY